MKWIVLALILCGCANRVMSTLRPRSIRPSLPPPPVPVQSSKLKVQSSRFVSKPTTLTLEWDNPASMEGIVGFKIYRGTNSGTYFADYPVTLTNRASVTFIRQIGEVDYFVCTSCSADGLESLPSNEVRWPPSSTYRFPTNIVLSWNAPAASVEGSSNFVTWQPLTNVTGSTVTLPIRPGSYFYRIATDRPTTLQIEPR